MRQSHKLVSLMLVAGMVAGCGEASVSSVAPMNQGALAARATQSAPAMAAAFAGLLKPCFQGTVTTKGAMVAATEAGQPTVTYDFSATPRTGQVAVATEGYTTQMAYDQLITTAQSSDSKQKFLPIVIVPIAIDMAIDGAKAYAWYCLTHPGSSYNQHDAIVAVVGAMAKAAVSFLPMSFLYDWLVPIVVKIIMDTPSRDYEHVLATAMQEIDQLVAAIKHALNHDQAPAVPAY